MQPQDQQHDPAAALAFATQLNQQLMPQQQTPSQEPQNAPGQEETQEPIDSPQEEQKEDVGAKMKDLELSMTQKLDEIRKELKDDQQREMDMLKKTITDAIR